jgi:hypothetical protein
VLKTTVARRLEGLAGIFSESVTQLVSWATSTWGLNGFTVLSLCFVESSDRSRRIRHGASTNIPTINASLLLRLAAQGTSVVFVDPGREQYLMK